MNNFRKIILTFASYVHAAPYQPLQYRAFIICSQLAHVFLLLVEIYSSLLCVYNMLLNICPCESMNNFRKNNFVLHRSHLYTVIGMITWEKLPVVSDSGL